MQITVRLSHEDFFTAIATHEDLSTCEQFNKCELCEIRVIDAKPDGSYAIELVYEDDPSVSASKS